MGRLRESVHHHQDHDIASGVWKAIDEINEREWVGAGADQRMGG